MEYTLAQLSLARIIDVAVCLTLPVLYSHKCFELYFMSGWFLLLCSLLQAQCYLMLKVLYNTWSCTTNPVLSGQNPPGSPAALHLSLSVF